MLIVYEVVTQRFTHSDQAKYNLFSNWLLWLMGGVHPTLSHIRQPAVLLEKGYSALCGQQAYLLQTLAEAGGIRTRAVGLNGHVVMEAWYNNDWHLYDPDLEVVPLIDNNRVLSLDELARLTDQIRCFYQGRGSEEYVDSIVDIIASREDNSFVLYWMTEKHLAYRTEKIAEMIKWIIPMILLVIGFWLFFKKTREL
jgi:hypothetical protein